MAHAKTAEVRLYDRLFKVENPSSEEQDFKEYINPDALIILPNVYIEPDLAKAKVGEQFQFFLSNYRSTILSAT